MKEIKHFMLPSQTNQLYKNEAISSIQFTKEVAEKINEIVDSLNEVEKIRLDKVQEQDGKIQKAILYLKDNVINTLYDILELKGPELVKDYAEDITKRLDNLLGKITDGSTTSDAELIDIRKGADGVSYVNAGTSIRSQLLNLKKELLNTLNNVGNDEMVQYTLVTGYIGSDYIMKGAGVKTQEVTTSYIEGKEGDVFRINCEYELPFDGQEWLCITFYDENKKAIKRHSGNEFIYNIDCYGWKYFRVSTRTYGNASIMIMKKNMNQIDAMIPTYSHKFNYEYVDTNWKGGYLNSGGTQLASTYRQVEIMSDYIPVVAGEKYHVIARAKNTIGIDSAGTNFHWMAIATYDGEKNFLSRQYTWNQSTASQDNTYILEGDFIVPAGVEYIIAMGRTYWNGSIHVAKVLTSGTNVVSTASIESCSSVVKAIAHRGFSSTCPENTLHAYKEAKNRGFYYVECDVRFTADNVPVLLHDATIDRTSNGTGDITALSLSQVRSLDFGSWFSPSFAGTKIPTFEEFIALCRKLSLHPYIELKGGTQTQIASLVQIVKKYGMIRKVTWIGGSPMITYIPSLDERARIGIVVSSVNSSNIVEASRLSTGKNEVFMDASTYTQSEIDLCMQDDIPLEVWTINDRTKLENLPPYVSGVTSDMLHATIELLNF